MLIEDFALDEPRLDWMLVNDSVMGGQSDGHFEISAHRLWLHGVLNTNGGGFASVRSRPEPCAAESASGIRVRVRGDGRVYQLRLATATPNVAYVVEFESEPGQWLDLTIPFADFVPRWRGRAVDGPPLDPGAIVSFGFMIADRKDGPFSLEVATIRFSAT